MVNGSEGLGFIPVWYDKTLVEWKLREKGGGLVNVHGSNSDIINRCQRDSQGRLITPSGETQITTTANHYGFALIDGVPTKCVINMTGSQLKHSRYFNTLIQGTKIEVRKGYLPRLLTLTCTVSKLNLSLMTVGLGIPTTFLKTDR